MMCRLWFAALLVSVSACGEVSPRVQSQHAEAQLRKEAGASAPVTSQPSTLGIPNLTIFDIPPLEEAVLAASKNNQIWFTAYISKIADEDESDDSVELKGSTEDTLGVRVSRRNWCHGAMEGTLSVKMKSRHVRVFNFHGTESGEREAHADCSDVLKTYKSKNPVKYKALVRSFFKEVTSVAPYGLGVSGRCNGRRIIFRLVPHRSVAVDSKHIPVGSVLFVESLRGAEITMPDGTVASHDGFVFAVDKGGAIKDYHVDYFKGPALSDSLPKALVSSEQNKLNAFVIKDAALEGRFCREHTL